MAEQYCGAIVDSEASLKEKYYESIQLRSTMNNTGKMGIVRIRSSLYGKFRKRTDQELYVQ